MKHTETVIIAHVASINTPAPTDIPTIAPKDKLASGFVVGGTVVELSMKQNIQYNYDTYSY